MPNSKTAKEGASKAINKTITIVEDALGIDVPRSSVPSISRETMVEMLKSGFRTPLAGCWCNQFAGWGSQVKSKGSKRSPAWVGTPDAYIDGNYRWKAMTPDFEKMLDEVAKHLHNGRLVDWGGKGWSDVGIRRSLISLDKWYRKQNPSFNRIRWNAQPPAWWNVFYVNGMIDINDPHTMGRVARALKSGKRIIDISGSVPDDLTAVYQKAVDDKARQRRGEPRGRGRAMTLGGFRKGRKGKARARPRQRDGWSRNDPPPK